MKKNLFTFKILHEPMSYAGFLKTLIVYFNRRETKIAKSPISKR